MQLKHLITIVVIATLALGLKVLITAWMTDDNTIDHRIAKKTMEIINFNEGIFGDHVTDIEIIAPGEYRILTDGIDDPVEAGKIAHNVIAALFNSALDLEVQRHTFVIEGFQDGSLIFRGYVSGSMIPEITLHGPFEGEEYSPETGYVPEPAKPEIRLNV